MDFSNLELVQALIVLFLITLPLLLVAVRLKQMLRILRRVEEMNLRSLQQQWRDR